MKIEEIIVVTGLSGAGKTTALDILEDMDYFTIDNMPIELKDSVLELPYKKIAIGIDVRTIKNTKDFFDIIDSIKNRKIKYDILFLDSSDEVILNRYNLTRRVHPVLKNTVIESIKTERALMEDIKQISTGVIDTSHMQILRLSQKIKDILGINVEKGLINVHLISFGYKYGIPIDANLLFDARFLDNPYYIKELKEKSGLDKEVVEYVMSSDKSKEFYKKLLDILEFLIPCYIEEGKKHLTVGIGCSGGKHRSVSIVDFLEKDLIKDSKINVYVSHREQEVGNWKN